MTNEALLDPALCRELGHVRKQLLPPAAASSSVILSSLELLSSQRVQHLIYILRD